MNEKFKDLAILYFEGRLTPNQECEFFGFIAADPENAAQMREWECEWKRQHTPSANVLQSLTIFNAKIEHRSNQLHTRRRWLRITSVAAASALIFLSTFAVLHITKPQVSEQFFTVEAPQGTRSHITLYDGTQVWLNAGSTMSYTSSFNNTSRDIHLSGEAYFEVARNEKLPFRVEVRGCTLTVLGTKFNVSAYDEDPTVQTALIEGSLRFETPQGSEMMPPDDLVTYDCYSPSMRCEQVDAGQFCSWIDGNIRYDAITLPTLLRKLAREHAAAIELCTADFDTKTFRISLTQAQDIESILNGLCDILPITVKRDENGYHVYGRP